MIALTLAILTVLNVGWILYTPIDKKNKRAIWMQLLIQVVILIAVIKYT